MKKRKEEEWRLYPAVFDGKLLGSILWCSECVASLTKKKGGKRVRRVFWTFPGEDKWSGSLLSV